MRIARIETIPVDVPIDPRLAIVGSRGGHLTSPFLVLRVHTDEDVTGVGEVSCTPGWSGEDRVTAAHLIATYLEPALVGEDPLDVARLSALMNARLAGNPFTRAGIEMALWDVLGKVAGLPLYRLWGDAQREFVPTKFSVSGVGPERAAEIARWAVERGFRAMKVKVGRDLAGDLERVAAVREAVGPEVRLGVDANGGWPPWIAIEAVERLTEFEIAFVEQPVARADLGWMAAVRSRSRIPIVADESVETVFDAMALVRAQAADALSIYVGKGAGLGMARKIANVAGAAGMACTVGSNGELGVASAAMIHLGMALPPLAAETLPCDILSTFLYEDMLLTEPLPVEAGRACPPQRRGLGDDRPADRVEHYRVG
jgi:L-alanine-DL-glutamate epimerase-like enolase superfamily enzyme